MNYQNHYDNLINRARNRILEGYKESHHIIPKCLGGTDERDNLVDLTAREHFIAHLLLWKIYPDNYGLIKAINMMCVGHSEHRSGNRMYGWLKEHFSTSMSLSQSGKGNSQFGTSWVYSISLKICKKIPKNEILDEGWFYGRVYDFSIFKNCPVCNIVHKRLVYCSNSCRAKDKKNNFEGKKHSKESKKIMREKAKGHKRNTGINNPSSGSKYMHNDELCYCKRIYPNDIETYSNNGWIIGFKKY